VNFYLTVVQPYHRLGLTIRPHGAKHPVIVAAGVGLAVGAYMALADATIFRSVIPPSQTALLAGTTAAERIIAFLPFAVLDELVFRLVLMTALVWIFTKLSDPRARRYWEAIVIVALIYLPLHPGYLASLGPITSMVATRELFLHVFVTALWGYLYWKHGLAASIAGHMAAHLSLQPLLGWFFG
jgi:hypothetical protein